MNAKTRNAMDVPTRQIVRIQKAVTLATGESLD